MPVPRRSADRELRRLSSLVTVGLLIARAALRREESRGGHFRTDFPQRDDIHWQKHVVGRAEVRLCTTPSNTEFNVLEYE